MLEPALINPRLELPAVPRHVGMIPDGNRRYAKRAELSVLETYLRAADHACELVGWCREAGVGHLSAFGVSQENILMRPREEIEALHVAVLRFCEDAARMSGVGVHLFGDAEALPDFIPGRDELMRFAKEGLPADVQLVAHVGLNYSSLAELQAIVTAVRNRGLDAVSARPEEFLLSAGVPPVDLVIRTGGQRRLSGYLPLQTAYAELYFLDTLFPEFRREEFRRALAWYAEQERHFGE